MGDETKNTGTDQAGTETAKTFSQEEVDKIVSDRLRRESSKYKDYDAIKNELEELKKGSGKEKDLKDEISDLKNKINAFETADKIRKIKDDIATDTGIPADLLVGSSEEDMREFADKLKKYIESQKGFPVIRDGGEARSGSSRKNAKESFIDMFNEKFQQ